MIMSFCCQNDRSHTEFIGKTKSPNVSVHINNVFITTLLLREIGSFKLSPSSSSLIVLRTAFPLSLRITRGRRFQFDIPTSRRSWEILANFSRGLVSHVTPLTCGASSKNSFRYFIHERDSVQKLDILEETY